MTQSHKMAASPSALKTAEHDFAATFAAFKRANDERLAQLEAKAASDPLTEEKVERINNALNVQQDRINRLSLSLSRSMVLDGHDPAAGGQVKSAWSAYIRTGDKAGLLSLEGKSLSASIDAEGGYIAPAETQSTIDKALSESSPFRRLCDVRTVGTGSFKKPVSAGGASAGWSAETDIRSETPAPQLELIDFPVGELYAMPAATQTLLDDSVADVDAWLAGEVQDVFAAQETAAFTQGDGIHKPKGLLSYSAVPEASQSWGALGYIATGVDGDFDMQAPIDSLLELIYAPAPRYRRHGQFIMNRRTISSIRKFKDADGNYIWQPSGQAGQPSTLLGYPLEEIEDMPDVAQDSFSAAFGDFRRGYLIVDRQGVRVLRDPYSAKPYVLFYTTKRVGGGIQDYNAIKLLKFAVS